MSAANPGSAPAWLSATRAVKQRDAGSRIRCAHPGYGIHWFGASLFLLCVSTPPAHAADFELQGAVAAEARLFAESAAFRGQHGANGSAVVRPEFYWSWADGSQSFTFSPYARLDQGDERRSHLDLRELLWESAGERWELRAGIGRVFWGVAESNHLVDVINQTDLVENPDTEDKLGQPLLNLAAVRDWGTVEVFVLPGFRERTFPGKSGRLRSQPRVDSSEASYESGAGRGHVDVALRYSQALGDLDLGLAHFHGTSREPRLLPARTRSGEPVLIPRYDQIDQTSLDAQYTVGSWLFKLEALHRSGQGNSFGAAVGGFEYTWVGIVGTQADLGALAEMNWDERGRAALTPFDRDLFTGLRLALNDMASTAVLAGVVSDLRGGGRFINVEASRRIGERWKLELEMRAFTSAEPDDLLRFVEHDDYVALELARYF